MYQSQKIEFYFMYKMSSISDSDKSEAYSANYITSDYTESSSEYSSKSLSGMVSSEPEFKLKKSTKILVSGSEETSGEDSELYTCCKCILDFDYDNIDFICLICEEPFCYDCKVTSYENEDECPNNNCYYCRNGSCFNNRTNGYYCESCVSEEYLEKLKQDILYQEQFEKDCEIRKLELIKALDNNGLKLRSDSELCNNYIYSDDESEDLDYIVERMSQMKFLFEYCKMRKCINKVKNNYEKTGDYYYYEEMFDESERLALNTYSNGDYPDKWPWIAKKLNKNTKIIQKGCYN